LQEFGHIHSFHSGAAETLRPFGQFGLGEAFLLARKGKREAQGKNFTLYLTAVDKVRQTRCDVVEKALSASYPTITQ